MIRNAKLLRGMVRECHTAEAGLGDSFTSFFRSLSVFLKSPFPTVQPLP